MLVNSLLFTIAVCAPQRQVAADYKFSGLPKASHVSTPVMPGLKRESHWWTPLLPAYLSPAFERPPVSKKFEEPVPELKSGEFDEPIPILGDEPVSVASVPSESVNSAPYQPSGPSAPSNEINEPIPILAPEEIDDPIPILANEDDFEPIPDILSPTAAFNKINPNISTPVSATAYLNSLPPSLPTSRSDLISPNTTFCWKRTTLRPFSLHKPCPPGSDIPKGFGICYPPCPNSMFGFGPSCWSTCPPSLPFSCGGSCTKTIPDCMSSIFTQISTITEVVYNLAAVMAPKGGPMTMKPLKQFTNAATQSAVRKQLTRVLNPKLGDGTEEVVDKLVASTFGGKKPDWGGLNPEVVHLAFESLYRPLCPE
jgi:hypothetical protein